MQPFKHIVIFITVAAILITSGAPSYIQAAEQQPQMDIHFIDVGQGDSVLIQTPSDKNILIDGGPPKAGDDVVAYLEKHHVKKIDLLIATHPDVDHIGGLIKVMKSIDVKKIIDSGKLYTTRTYAKYISQILKQKIPVTIAEQNQLIQIDPLVKMRILNTHSSAKNNNESSIVLRVSFKEVDFLLMADVEKEQERQLMKKYNLEAEILKVAHHGSSTSTSKNFLKEVKPNLAVITYSKENDYGHPVDRVIENLKKVNAHIYSTAVFGNITISTNGESYMVITEKSPTSVLKAG